MRNDKFLYIRNLALLVALASTFFSFGKRELEELSSPLPRRFAFVNVTVVKEPGKVFENTTLFIEDKYIKAIGDKVKIPEDTIILNGEGKVIYPGFIDLGILVNRKEDLSDKPSNDSSFVTPHLYASSLLRDFKGVTSLRDLGVTTVLVSPTRGVIKGMSSLLSLLKDSGRVVVKEKVALNVGWQTRRDGYPTSIMGAIALFRQSLYDTIWLLKNEKIVRKNPFAGKVKLVNEQLLPLVKPGVSKDLIVLFHSRNPQETIHFSQLVEEFDLVVWIYGSGKEYRWIDELKKTGFPHILPINFAKPKKEENLKYLDLKKLDHYSKAPYNYRIASDARLVFALTTEGVKNRATFNKLVREILATGITKEELLRAFTIVPASMLALDSVIGKVEEGYLANFVVADGLPFTNESILEVWVEGERFFINDENTLKGRWKLVLTKVDGNAEYVLELLFKDRTLVIEDKNRKISKKVKFLLIYPKLEFVLPKEFVGKELEIQMVRDGDYYSGSDKNGEYKVNLSKSVKVPKVKLLDYDSSPNPYLAWRAPKPFSPRRVVFKNAVIWSMGKRGTFEGDILVEEGIIRAIGKDIEVPSNSVVFDLSGKHITPGIIDAHSHIAVRGSVNEFSNVVTSEVRISDVIDAEDVNIYRALAGGVTTANLLHGSANVIGGQTVVIKLKWGSSPDELIFKLAPPGIKFALGENPKQSNWRRATSRFPQTRSGIEKVLTYYFNKALLYRDKQTKKGEIFPHKDIQLDPLVEVLNKTRVVNAHSYRADEILMLLKVADRFGFKVDILQHVLEGYKVAPEIARRGFGASTFSDWWSYKYEVIQAIPYNVALMHKAGVLVSINSDSAEVIRRLPQEAAKAMRYGGLSAEDALALITINPAKQLRIDWWVGSIEPGKQADLVVWSGHPLDYSTVCLETWIEGKRYFSREEDITVRSKIKTERETVIRYLEGKNNYGKEKNFSNNYH